VEIQTAIDDQLSSTVTDRALARLPSGRLRS
jgi:hypothetical protein